MTKNTQRKSYLPATKPSIPSQQVLTYNVFTVSNEQLVSIPKYSQVLARFAPASPPLALPSASRLQGGAHASLKKASGSHNKAQDRK